MKPGIRGCEYGPDHSLGRELCRAAAEEKIDLQARLEELNSRIA